MAQIKNFKDLKVWQKSHNLVLQVYEITSIFPSEEKYGLISQMRRAAISMASNIVEGFEKNSTNEFIRYLRIAKGSTGEVSSQLHIAFSVNYLTKEEFEVLNRQFTRLSSDIGGLIRYLEKYRQTKTVKRLSR